MQGLFLTVCLICSLLQDVDYQKPEVSLSGSPKSQHWQNKKADEEGLKRYSNRDLPKAKRSGEIVPLLRRRYLVIDRRLKGYLRFCRPWTNEFISDLGNEYYHTFGHAWRIDSAVRTVERQKQLRRHNANAADISGDEASSHLTGATIDIAKAGMSEAELEWMRERLLWFEKRDEIEATEEFHQSVFHVMIFKNYRQDAP